MNWRISERAARVLGCLLEKEMATPDYYPLSLNALVNACNQKSNRQPVVEYDETEVVRALNELKELQLAWQSDASRVPKYGENFIKLQNMVAREAAVIALLLLRGPQTVGELRGRSERLYAFESLEEVEQTLAAMEESGFVRKLARQPGQKECRYAQLMAGEPDEAAGGGGQHARMEEATQRVRAEEEQLAELTEEVQRLRDELAELRAAFFEFRKQFE
ncbi:MAG: YceH family protein [Thermodesulfobacteriota bacterium]